MSMLVATDQIGELTTLDANALQGRILFDAFVYPENKGGEFPHPSFLVDVDTATAPKFEAHLRRYKLRNRITVTNLASDEFVWQAWGRNAHLLWGSYVDRMSAKNMPPGSVVPKESFCDVGCRDPRHASLGVRFVLDMSQSPPDNLQRGRRSDFALRRILLGIPEGSSDFFAEQSLPLESNLDYMNGVDFRKGCYLGQELTIRTYHTGVTRKRIVPVQLYNKDDPAPETLTLDKSWTAELPESQTDIKVAGSEDAAKDAGTPVRTRGSGVVGKFCGGMYNVGLALVRLEHVHSPSGSVSQTAEGTGDAQQGNEPADSHGFERAVSKDLVTASGLRMRAFAPSWWPVAPPE
ncbi:hypothetical protein BC831DRAFT_510840 [Entophlyctis helioformis]|nr:hypothetical protein BC831DRAFT_510840 [Entophlyctis helioformis]